MASPVYLVDDNRAPRDRITVLELQVGEIVWPTVHHSIALRKTEYPAESGVRVIDHAVREPAKLILSGIAAEAPIPPQGLPLPALGDQLPPQANPQNPGAVWRAAAALMDAKTLVEVYTALGRYPDMLITNLEADQTARTGANLSFTMTLEEFQTVERLSGLEAAAEGLDRTVELPHGNVTSKPLDVSEIVTSVIEPSGIAALGIEAIPLSADGWTTQTARIRPGPAGGGPLDIRIAWNTDAQQWQFTAPATFDFSLLNRRLRADEVPGNPGSARLPELRFTRFYHVEKLPIDPADILNPRLYRIVPASGLMVQNRPMLNHETLYRWNRGRLYVLPRTGHAASPPALRAWGNTHDLVWQPD